jgi:hypothetical protein
MTCSEAGFLCIFKYPGILDKNHRMRYLLSALLLLIAPGLHPQDKTNITVFLDPMDCRPNAYPSIISADSVQFFKLPEDTLALFLDLHHWRTLPMPLSLPRADYRIVYKNIYGQTVNKGFRLYKDSMRIKLCPDSLLAYPANTLARLKDKDSLVIRYRSIGCFNDNTERLVITRRGQQLAAAYYKDDWYSSHAGAKLKHRFNVLAGKKILTPEDILQFVRFENELKYVHRGGCTTTDYYFITSKYLTIAKEDGSCTWGGFRLLTNGWFYRTVPVSKTNSQAIPAPSNVIVCQLDIRMASYSLYFRAITVDSEINTTHVQQLFQDSPPQPPSQ